MLYLGIDLHRKQLTVSVRNEKGDVILAGVSTRWERVREFLEWIKGGGRAGGRIRSHRGDVWLRGLAD